MAVIKKDGNSMGLPMNINRGNPIPIDSTTVWYSYAEAKNYASNGATAYVGQILTVVDEINKTSTVYIIANTDGDLIALSLATGKLPGVLTIGNHTYDGSSNVTIELYDGTYTQNS